MNYIEYNEETELIEIYGPTGVITISSDELRNFIDDLENTARQIGQDDKFSSKGVF